MSNRTVKDAHAIRGSDPQHLIEKIIRTRIYDCRYWKEHCFGLTAELVVDKAIELKFIGGVFGGNIAPCDFLCIVLRMLQIQPEKDIIVEFIKNEEFKYVRALGVVYMRLVGTSLDCYKYLEPIYNDYRKLKRQNRSGLFEIVHMDELIDELLREERVCDVILPRIQKRHVLEELNQLEIRISVLEDDLDDVELDSDAKSSPEPHEEAPKGKSTRKSSRGRSKERRSSSKRKSSRGRSKERRSSSKSKSSSSRSKERRRETRKKEKHHRSTGRKSEDDHRKKGSELDREIAEANELRAKLGMAPLRI